MAVDNTNEDTHTDQADRTRQEPTVAQDQHSQKQMHTHLWMRSQR